MLSIPPAIIKSDRFKLIESSANIIDFNPEPQTLFIVKHSTLEFNPAPIADCLAGACPKLADNTFPIITSSTLLISTDILSNTDFITTEPNFVAGIRLKEPLNAPIGVLE